MVVAYESFECIFPGIHERLVAVIGGARKIYLKPQRSVCLRKHRPSIFPYLIGELEMAVNFAINNTVGFVEKGK